MIQSCPFAIKSNNHELSARLRAAALLFDTVIGDYNAPTGRVLQHIGSDLVTLLEPVNKALERWAFTAQQESGDTQGK